MLKRDLTRVGHRLKVLTYRIHCQGPDCFLSQLGRSNHSDYRHSTYSDSFDHSKMMKPKTHCQMIWMLNFLVLYLLKTPKRKIEIENFLTLKSKLELFYLHWVYYLDCKCFHLRVCLVFPMRIWMDIRAYSWLFSVLHQMWQL
jgi:hypothetical protein